MQKAPGGRQGHVLIEVLHDAVAVPVVQGHLQAAAGGLATSPLLHPQKGGGGEEGIQSEQHRQHCDGGPSPAGGQPVQ